jgi:NAD(P)-dependent dehydrogenase (short-subunit alcohol dehydrogenase family)
MASVAGIIGTPGLSAYTAAKHGVLGLTKTAALECARTGVRVNAICPSVVRTPMIQRLKELKPEMAQQMLEMSPEGRMGEPEEVARGVVWLCSDEASFVMGHALTVDGGLTVP